MVLLAMVDLLHAGAAHEVDWTAVPTAAAQNSRLQSCAGGARSSDQIGSRFRSKDADRLANCGERSHDLAQGGAAISLQWDGQSTTLLIETSVQTRS
jgi:hypothetical protein